MTRWTDAMARAVLARMDRRRLDEQQERTRARLDAETEREEIARDEDVEPARVQGRGDA